MCGAKCEHLTLKPCKEDGNMAWILTTPFFQGPVYLCGFSDQQGLSPGKIWYNYWWFMSQVESFRFISWWTVVNQAALWHIVEKHDFEVQTLFCFQHIWNVKIGSGRPRSYKHKYFRSVMVQSIQNTLYTVTHRASFKNPIPVLTVVTMRWKSLGRNSFGL